MFSKIPLEEKMKVLREKEDERVLGDIERRVAILGAFDTWVFMHHVAIEVARLGYTAVTSRYIYWKDKRTEGGYYRSSQRPDEEKSMTDFLKNEVIGRCSKAVIIYSVPAAHYNEAEWCCEMRKPTLGLTFVRRIEESDGCLDCIMDPSHEFSHCQGTTSAWDCIKKKGCPFKSQEIAKNQLEYYTLIKRDQMGLIAIEKIEKLQKILKDFLRNKLVLPKRRPYVLEFRTDLPNNEKSALEEKLNSLIQREKSEEDLTEAYEYFDYYYKPVDTPIDKWLSKQQTIRIRRWEGPWRSGTSIIVSKLLSKESGIQSVYPRGRLEWFKGDFNDAQSLLTEHQFELFLIVYKDDGLTYRLRKPFEFNVSLERVLIGERNAQLMDIGWYAEIELWISGAENFAEIRKKINKILKILRIPVKRIDSRPMQNIAFEKWQEAQR